MTFQSTPANFTAGDSPGRTARPGRDPGFNPRPPISQRATLSRCLQVQVAGVSIHARQFHSGRLDYDHQTLHAEKFQSTPANFTAGDAQSFGINPTEFQFQSTPANFTAGDQPTAGHSLVANSRFNPRPPISQRATAVADLAQAIRMFQSTPANFTAGDLDRSGGHSRKWLFQSTPANFTAGDQRVRAVVVVGLGVSIHARQFHSGRRG